MNITDSSNRDNGVIQLQWEVQLLEKQGYIKCRWALVCHAGNRMGNRLLKAHAFSLDKLQIKVVVKTLKHGQCS